jgi:hypothetical protein
MSLHFFVMAGFKGEKKMRDGLKIHPASILRLAAFLTEKIGTAQVIVL